MKTWILILLTVGILGSFAFTYLSKPNIAYVQSQVLFEKYAGRIEAEQIWQQKQNQWQANLDTLSSDFQRKSKQGISTEERQSLTENIKQYKQTVERLSKESELKQTQAVLDQINVFIEQYGKDHKFDLILGTTADGNILFGKSNLDITDELLAAMNKNYNPANYGD